MTLEDLQAQHQIWADHNFPDQPPHRPLLGIIEEVGELSHAHLKEEQQIRGNEDHRQDKVDAIGDILIYMAHYCNLNGIDMQKALDDTWNGIVKQRDWIVDSEHGTDPDLR